MRSTGDALHPRLIPGTQNALNRDSKFKEGITEEDLGLEVRAQKEKFAFQRQRQGWEERESLNTDGKKKMMIRHVETEVERFHPNFPCVVERVWVGVI